MARLTSIVNQHDKPVLYKLATASSYRLENDVRETNAGRFLHLRLTLEPLIYNLLKAIINHHFFAGQRATTGMGLLQGFTNGDHKANHMVGG